MKSFIKKKKIFYFEVSEILKLITLLYHFISVSLILFEDKATVF